MTQEQALAAHSLMSIVLSQGELANFRRRTRNDRALPVAQNHSRMGGQEIRPINNGQSIRSPQVNP